MLVQLRTYALAPESLPAWVAVFNDHIRPIRESLGFTVPAAWTEPEHDRFVWLLALDADRQEWDRRDAAFRSAPARLALDPDPARMIRASETRFVELLP